jgi:hypothetical protein
MFFSYAFILPFKGVLRRFEWFPHLSPSGDIQMHWIPLEWPGMGLSLFWHDLWPDSGRIISCTGFYPHFFLYWIYSIFFQISLYILRPWVIYTGAKCTVW